MELHNLFKTYGDKKVLDIKELHIEQGRIYGIVGENGAGKTTLFRILAGLSFPTGGSIEFADSDERLGVMIEMPAIDLNMTAEENLRWLSKVYGKESCRDIQEVLEIVCLKNINKKVKKFSLGMKQRLGIAMCLLHNPKLLILDEPMNGLDPSGMIELRNTLLDINKSGTTILLSSHLLEEVYKLATDYIFIKKGEVVQIRTSTELEEQEKGCYELATSDNERAMRVLKEELGCEVCMEGSKLLIDIRTNEVLYISKCLSKREIYILNLNP